MPHRHPSRIRTLPQRRMGKNMPKRHVGNVEPQAGAAEPALNHDPVSQADPAIPAHDSGVLRNTEHAAEPNPTTAAHGDPEDRRDAAQDAGILTDDEPESRSA